MLAVTATATVATAVSQGALGVLSALLPASAFSTPQSRLAKVTIQGPTGSRSCSLLSSGASMSSAACPGTSEASGARAGQHAHSQKETDWRRSAYASLEKLRLRCSSYMGKLRQLSRYMPSYYIFMHVN